MRIVIDIPEHYIENNIKRVLPITLSEDNIVAILSKGHGRLKDVDKIIIESSFDMWTDNGYGPMVAVEDINNAPTIIEADEDGDADGTS